VSSAPRVLLADDHAPTRAGVRMALEADGLIVCAEAADATQAVEAALRERPDLCLLDVRMPGGGTSAASTISARLPNTVVIMLTVSSDDQDLFESLRRGAMGYLLKDMDPTKLPVAIRAALRGDAALPRALTSRLIDQFRQRPAWHERPISVPGGAELTKREAEVLELICQGAGTTEIAERLFLSPVTVRRHISTSMRKLGASSRQELVQLALGEGTPRPDARD
jgi:DNA-binding NarL/FixJ family response regulator